MHSDLELDFTKRINNIDVNIIKNELNHGLHTSNNGNMLFTLLYHSIRITTLLSLRMVRLTIIFSMLKDW